MSNDFAVSSHIFEGPLNLLLDLIEKRKLHINEISLSHVTNDFLDFVGSLEQKNLDKLTEFISIASTLILIKSKSLLPQGEVGTEEQTEIEDLELRLKLLQIFKNASILIKESFNTKPLFSRRIVKQKKIVFLPTEQIECNKIQWYISQLIHNLPKSEKKPEKKMSKTISLEEMMNKVINRVKQNISISFNTLNKEHSERKNVIISFLAILELVKLGTVSAEQDKRFDDILVESKQPTIPNYGI